MGRWRNPLRPMITAHVDLALVERLKAMAEQHDRPVAAEIRLALRHHVTVYEERQRLRALEAQHG
jgi:hypothetical protein